MHYSKNMYTKTVVMEGFRDGIPIGLGYFAVAFSLGIAAANAGLNAFQGALVSLLNNASAGEYAGFTCIASQASYIETILITFVANARYLLMSCALSSRCHENLSTFHRTILGFYITDELFGITIARSGYVNPYYTYGAIVPATILWAAGTSAGIIAGNVLPNSIVSALSVALYGMFIAIIIPPSKKSKAVLITVAASFLLSFLWGKLSFLNTISSGTKTIILTVIIAAAAAIIAPVHDEDENEDKEEEGASDEW